MWHNQEIDILQHLVEQHQKTQLDINQNHLGILPSSFKTEEVGDRSPNWLRAPTTKASHATASVEKIPNENLKILFIQ
jgi:hypothetical protein